jgi:O-antigen/teichoic acid export membrane protein
MIDTITFPELQYEIGLKNYAKAGKLYRFSFWISVTIASMGVAFLLLFGKWFYSIWTKDSLVVKDDVWFILILGILFNSMWWIGGVVLRAFNMPYKLTIPAVLCAFASLIVSYFMSLKYSLFGIGIGCLFFEVIMVVLILPQSVNLLEMNLKDFLNSGLIDLKTGLKQLIKKA